MNRGKPEVEHVQIRHTIVPGDLGRILQLQGILYAKELGLDLTFEGYVARTLGHFERLPDPKRERLWLAELEERLVGCVAIVEASETESQLRWLLVDPIVRGKGLGRTLVQAAVAFATEAGYHSLFLETLRELPTAAALYRSCGFELRQEQTCQLWGRELTDQRYVLPLSKSGTIS
jgi:GNAT superfamily N-acetyltransferase